MPKYVSGLEPAGTHPQVRLANFWSDFRHKHFAHTSSALAQAQDSITHTRSEIIAAGYMA